ncbi:hypothetical protein F5I97DRAFT_1934552 [Phlebopus sp. FC_14]|nr:hypothetical protein F5I97DRAFT_1934552 [Phlebopus sp. FC_14]
MAPLSLQGLNVVHSEPAPSSVDAHDAHDPLASPFPDFSAHLDLWTNLAFESDEPIPLPKLKRKIAHDNDDDAHDVVVQSTKAAPAPSPPQPAVNSSQFDLSALLATFGVEQLIPPPSPVQHQNTPPAHIPPVPSLAQLLALHAAQGGTYSVPPPTPVVAPQPPAPHPPPKRARTQKSSSITDNTDVLSPASTAPRSPEDSNYADANATPLSAAEDKRRRNTAASARFRLKKKEREAALERRAKELEERVVELERECEGLRRENGWLKGLVVGVTGAGAGAQQQQAKAN